VVITKVVFSAHPPSGLRSATLHFAPKGDDYLSHLSVELTKQQITLIEDITDFARQQKQHLDNNQLDKLIVPIETVFKTTDSELNKKIGI